MRRSHVHQGRLRYTNDTARIRRHPMMTAINVALQVDLSGQVCADSIGRKIYRGGHSVTRSAGGGT